MKGEIEEKKFNNIWCDLSDEEMYELTKLAYKKFYFRPKMLDYHILKIRSFDEFIRYVKTGLKIFYEKFGDVHWSKKRFKNEAGEIQVKEDNLNFKNKKSVSFFDHSSEFIERS